jgi:putative transposase
MLFSTFNIPNSNRDSALMPAAVRQQQAYDHRLRLYVHDTGDVQAARQLGVPRSTAHGWRTRDCRPVVTLNDAGESELAKLTRENEILKRRVAQLRAWLGIAIVIPRLSRSSFERHRLPEGKDKARLLRAIDRGSKVAKLSVILHVVGLSGSRYHVWKNAKPCELSDASSCPKSHPLQATHSEAEITRDMATSGDYRHVPTSTLSRLAQRLGKVHLSASTWCRLMRKHNRRRPRKRVHPAKPKIGIRASRANETWHVDATLIQLLDGSKVYLHAVIDNFSRRILAWKASDQFDPSITAELLNQAASGIKEAEPPQLMVDGGVENFNGSVDAAIISLNLKRVLAQTEVTFSNSMIEAWWRVLKHQWLFLNELDSLSKVTSLVTFYVDQHNRHLPHSAFKG